MQGPGSIQDHRLGQAVSNIGNRRVLIAVVEVIIIVRAGGMARGQGDDGGSAEKQSFHAGRSFVEEGGSARATKIAERHTTVPHSTGTLTVLRQANEYFGRFNPFGGNQGITRCHQNQDEMFVLRSHAGETPTAFVF